VIKTNLSTRPFYNERAVHIALIVLAAIVVAATAFNVSRILRYSSSDTRLATQASRDEAQAADLRQQAARLRASVDPQQVELASAGARQANDLIDRRTFSWTELLNRFETTLPDEVRITAVRPSVDREKGITLRVNVVARGVDDVSEFMESIDTTGAFRNVVVAEEHVNEEGLLESTLEMGYVPSSGKLTGERATEEKAAVAQEQTDAGKPAPEEPPASGAATSPGGARSRGAPTTPGGARGRGAVTGRGEGARR
jgi:type IV pilus assembly protein PilN